MNARRSTLACVAAAALVLATPAAAGERIIGGTTASPGEYPAHGNLAIDDGSGTFPGQCGGTLISSEWFLTAGHCVTDFGLTLSPGQFSVLLGDVDLAPPNAPDSFYNVITVDRFSLYNAFTLENDVALVRLGRPAPYQPVRVIRTDEGAKWAAGTTARIIGWGWTTPTGAPSTVLLEADAPMRADSVCQDPSSYGADFFASSMVCAGDGTTDTCKGDSGGPLMVPDGPNAFVLVGVTSWGFGCADPQFPGVYARLGAPALNAWVTGPRPAASFTSTQPHAGRPVTLTSTSTNPESGHFDTFSWDLDADGQYDDAAGATVTTTFSSSGLAQVGLQASSPVGDWASTRQTLTVNALPSANAGGELAYPVREGGSVALRGSGFDPEGQPLAFRWDLDGDHAFETLGATPRFSAVGLDGPVTRVVTLEVCDPVGGCAEATALIRVSNAPPRANAGPDRRTKRRKRLRFRVRITDPGRGDRQRVVWNWGDRRRSRGRTAFHAWRRPGLYRVRVTVVDDDGARAVDTVRVRVRR